jgi:hypothetical protein
MMEVVWIDVNGDRQDEMAEWTAASGGTGNHYEVDDAGGYGIIMMPEAYEYIISHHIICYAEEDEKAVSGR